MISILSGFTRYGMTYGVPATTNSLVPGIRPGRPDAGYMRSRSTAFTNVAATFSCGLRIGSLDVFLKCLKMPEQTLGPNNAHFGRRRGGDLRDSGTVADFFVPHDLSH